MFLNDDIYVLDGFFVKADVKSMPKKTQFTHLSFVMETGDFPPGLFTGLMLESSILLRMSFLITENRYLFICHKNMKIQITKHIKNNINRAVIIGRYIFYMYVYM